MNNHQLCTTLNEDMANTATAFLSCLYAKDVSTFNHSRNVAFLCAEMAGILKLDNHTRDSIFIAGLLHDIGKIGINDAIIRKKTGLTENEYDAVKEHPQIGRQMLSSLPVFNEIGNFIAHHHERYDGAGYPDGLSGESIPFESRLIAVADSFDAMTTRVYANKDKKSAIREIRECVGSQFDFEIAESLFLLNK